MEKLTAVMAKIDTKAPKDAKLQRWTIGSLGTQVKGALWLPRDVKLPCEIVIGFLANSNIRIKNKKEINESTETMECITCHQTKHVNHFSTPDECDVCFLNKEEKGVIK